MYIIKRIRQTYQKTSLEKLFYQGRIVKTRNYISRKKRKQETIKYFLKSNVLSSKSILIRAEISGKPNLNGSADPTHF